MNSSYKDADASCGDDLLMLKSTFKCMDLCVSVHLLLCVQLNFMFKLKITCKGFVKSKVKHRQFLEKNNGIRIQEVEDG